MEIRWSGEDKYRALLAIAEAANSRRDLSSVLDSVAEALEGLVSVDAVGVLTREGEASRPIAVHLRSKARREDEPHQAYVQRVVEETGGLDETPLGVLAEIERMRRSLVIHDVPADPRLGRVAALRSIHAKCLVLVPLFMGESFVGGIGFVRMAHRPFSPGEVAVLEDLSRPVTTAVANALAFDEIRVLRARLEEENWALKEEIDSSLASGGIIGASS